MNNTHRSSSIAPLNNTTETPGRDLLRLLKTRDKLSKDTSNSDDLYEIEEEIISLLNSLSISFQRLGLLHSNSAAIEILSALSDGTSGGGPSNDKGGGKKRKRKGDKAHSITAAQYGIHLDSQGRTNEEGGEKNDLDEGKLLTALCRIVGVGKKAQNDDADGDGKKISLEIVAASCQVLISICQHAIHGSDTRSSIVKDMIGSITCHLLDALHHSISNCTETIKSNEKDSAAIAALVSALKASSSILCLIQTRCAQTKAGERTLQELRATAWLVLNSIDTCHGDVMKAAAVLLASFPLAGDSENTPQSTLWSQCIKEGIFILRFAINDFFPVNEKDISAGTEEEKRWTAALKEHEKWMASVKDSTDNSNSNDTIDLYRRDKFHSRVECLTNYLLALVGMEGYPNYHGGINNLSYVSFPLQSILDISETLLSFPLAAEIKHRSLPTRLRSTPVDRGLISPNAAISIAASMRYSGHSIFDAAVSSCRGITYCKARRIVAICISNLQSSVSRGLLSVVLEGRKSIDGRKDGISAQLRSSIPLRIKSIETFHTVIVSLGSGVISSVGTSKSISKGVVLVGGCLLEQIQGCCGGVGSFMEEEWGTLGERGNLVETCSNALAGIVSSFGGAIPSNVRGTIDSITHSCLSTMYSVGSKSVLVYSHVKQSLLQLGINSVCMPWGDGGRSTLMRKVRAVASMLRGDPDVAVASRALSTLCALDAMVTPRAPALLIPSRETVDDSVDTISATEILEGIKAVSEDKTKTNRDSTQKKRKKVDKNDVAGISVNDASKQISGPTTVENDATKGETKSNEPKVTPILVGAGLNVKEKRRDLDTHNEKKDFDTKATTDTQHPDSTKQGTTLKVAKTSNTGEHISSSNSKPLNDKEERSSSSDDSSMEDFPEIVDEDPDEEDIA